MKEPIDILRFAMACIWTELEYNEDQTLAIENAMTIAKEAKEITNEWAKPKTLGGPGSSTNGIEAWRELYPK